MAKYSPELVEKIAGYIARGNFATVACAASGITETTYYEWLKDPNKPEFYESIKEAEALAEINAVEKIQNDDSWQSKAWFLERKFKDRWSKTETQNLNHSGQIDPSKRTLDDYYKDSGTT